MDGCGVAYRTGKGSCTAFMTALALPQSICCACLEACTYILGTLGAPGQLLQLFKLPWGKFDVGPSLPEGAWWVMLLHASTTGLRRLFLRCVLHCIMRWLGG